MHTNGKKRLTKPFALFAVSIAALIAAVQANAEKPVPVDVVSPLPLPVTGRVSGNVSIVNTPLPVTANSPLPVRAADNRVPFTKLLCVPTGGGCAQILSSGFVTLDGSFVVPDTTSSGKSVQQLVIEYVSGTCVGTARSTFVQLTGVPAGALEQADTGDNFSRNIVPLEVAQFLQAAGVNGAQAFGQKTQIAYAPGTKIEITFDFVAAGVMSCKAQLNGYFVTGG